MTNKELEEFNKHRKIWQICAVNYAAVGRQAEDRPMDSP